MSGFSSEEKALVERLIEVGMHKNEAKTLMAFAGVETTTSGDIENKTGLRQPEVSLAVQALREKGWITKTDRKKEESGKGSPIHLYSLSVDFSEIVEDLEEEMEKKIQEKKENIQKIKELSEEAF